MLPTAKASLTEPATILGTFHYMAPEQIEGHEADSRTDLFAFGCLLYEMLTGQKAFQGKTHASLIAAIMHVDPPLVSTIQPITPRALDRVVKKCLAKDADDRWQSARDLRDELKWIAEPGTGAGDMSAAITATRVAHAARWRRALPWAIAIGALGVASGIAIRSVPPGTPFVVRSTIPLVEPAWVGDGAVAFAPDGASVVYEGSANGRSQLFQRRLSDIQSIAIAGTEDGLGPFFSPDGQWIGFFARGQLLKVPVGGGRPTVICEVESFGGASWGDDGHIVVGTTQETGLFRVPAAGGPREPLTVPTADDEGNDHRWPQVLPGGRGVIFMVGTGPEDAARIVVLDSRTGARKELLRGSASARYVATGHLVYARNAELFAMPFDLDRLEISGAEVRLAGGVAEGDNGAPEYSFSAAGDLVYVPGWSGGRRDIPVFVDMQGTVEKTALVGGYFSPRVSPDGRRIAFTVSGAKNNVWVYETERGTSTRVTFGRYHWPIWTPDGRLTMSQGPPGRLRLIRRSADGDRTDEEITAAGGLQHAGTWTADGRTLYYERQQDGTQWDLWAVSPGLREPTPVVASRFNEQLPRLSPDGRWLAYTSDETGRAELYVRALQGDGQRWRVSVDGATFAVWAPDGQRLYYRGPGAGSAPVGMWAVDIATSPTFRASRPRLLFPAPGFLPHFDIARDGKRFVMVQENATPPPAQLYLVLNWFKTLPRSSR